MRGALFAQRRQHDRHHLVDSAPACAAARRRTGPTCNSRSSWRTRSRSRRCRGTRAAGRCCARRKLSWVPNGSGIRVSGLPRCCRQHLLVRHVVRHLAQAVHVVGEGEQPGLDLVLGQHAEGVAHHGGARDLAEGADMRQARRAVAGLEQHLVLRVSFSAARQSLSPARTARRWIVRRASADRSGWRQGRSWTSGFSKAAETSASAAKCKMTGGNP